MQEVFVDYINYIGGLKNYSRNTISAYEKNLSMFETWLQKNDADIFKLTANDVRVFISELANEKLSPATINQVLSTIRGFYDFAVRFKLAKINPAAQIKNIKLAERLPNFLFADEMNRFCKSPDSENNLWQARDKAIFSCLYSSGCRVSELVNLNLKDLSIDFKSAIVFGKGSKERKVFFADFAVQVLKTYMLERKTLLDTLQNIKEPALFLNQKGKRLTSRGVEYIISRYVEATGSYKKITPHTFRHSFASMLVTKGLDIRMVQELLGHASISTTQKYTHVTSEQLQNLYHSSHPHGAIVHEEIK